VSGPAQPLAIVTGASAGIGLATARAFAAAGHSLLLVARHIEPLADFAQAPVAYARVDVADFEALAGAVRDAEARFGGADCVVNSAGVLDARAFDAVDPESYRREIETNVVGVLNGIKCVLGGMLARGRGTIINMSSLSDRKTAPVAVGYTATKYAVRALSESLREAYGRSGVRVVSIAPGYVRTNIHRQMGITFEAYRERLGNPEFMTAEELAEIVLYCYRLPAHLCIRDLVVAPTRTAF
jgi:NADP-dependent 3-hydroxy acid dehydrogenase YdfG